MDRTPVQDRQVLLLGGAEPLGGIVAERLVSVGHRLAVHDVAVPPGSRHHAAAPNGDPAVVLSGDRRDADDVTRAVESAGDALGALDAVVVLPGRRCAEAGLDSSTEAWAEGWSQVLAAEVLAPACAAHAAARSFIAQRRAGRIVLVVGRGDAAGAGGIPGGLVEAAVTRLGADLTHELGPHGIGVSVITVGAGGAAEFALAQVADLVEALLSTPVLSGGVVQVG